MGKQKLNGKFKKKLFLEVSLILEGFNERPTVHRRRRYYAGKVYFQVGLILHWKAIDTYNFPALFILTEFQKLLHGLKVHSFSTVW